MLPASPGLAQLFRPHRHPLIRREYLRGLQLPPGQPLFPESSTDRSTRVALAACSRQCFAFSGLTSSSVTLPAYFRAPLIE